MTHADEHNLSSNALFVLREERELVSLNDFIKDYILKHPHCHYTTQPEQPDFKEKVENVSDKKKDKKKSASPKTAEKEAKPK
jgi:hypothetical protein